MFLMINKCNYSGYRKSDAYSLHTCTYVGLSASYFCDNEVNKS